MKFLIKVIHLWRLQEEKERKEMEEQRKKHDDDAKKKKALSNMSQQYSAGQKVNQLLVAYSIKNIMNKQTSRTLQKCSCFNQFVFNG